MRLKEATTDHAVHANGVNTRLKWLLLSVSAIALAQVVPLSPAAAQTSQWNGFFSSDWFTGGNWGGGVPTHNAEIITPGGVPTPTISTGQAADITGFVTVGLPGQDGHLIIQNGGSLTQHTQSLNIGGNNASVTVTGDGSALIGRTGSQGIGTITVGTGSGAGTLEVLDGASVTGYRIDVALNAGTVGAAVFSGQGTNVTVPTGGTNPWLSVGFNGNGTLEISDGATVSSVIGAMATENGIAFASIEGAGSRWTITGGGEFHVAGAGTATLNIIDGGTFDAGTSFVNIGRDDGGNGEVTVDGAGSLLTTTNDINVGNAGTGTLTVQNGGTVTTGGTLHIARVAGNGTLNIGAGLSDPAEAPGTVNAAAVQFGAGIGEINFNHTSSNYVFAPPIHGPGVVNVIAGTTILTGDSDYSGGTNISSGATLQLGNGGTTGSITGEVNNSGTLVFDRSNTYVFDGLITGSGGVVQQGTGATIFNGFNFPYFGPTTINNGALIVNGEITSETTVNPNGTLGGTGAILLLDDQSVFNSGTIAPGPLESGFGALTIDGGSYVGQGGTLRIRTALGDDSSATDQLVISNSTATGSTGVRVINQGGGGAQTNIGIPIIVAEGTTTMQSTAFSLAGPVVAGLYQYQLFQGTPGGTGTPDQEQSWYLRSTVQDDDGNPVPLTRPEGPLYSVMPGLARALNVTTLGTFHDRNGDQGLVRGGPGVSNRAWGRLFGEGREHSHGGRLGEHFKGHAGGLQAGLDLFNYLQPNGQQDRAGFFVGYSAAEGDVRGLALARQNAFVGSPKLAATSVGAYWTHVGPSGGYLDAVMMGSFYSGRGESTNNIHVDVDGSAFAASLEGGYPIPLGGGLTLEPQAQVIFQHLSLDGRDPFTTVDYETPSAWYGRIGVRLAGDFTPWGWAVRPYLKANLVHDWMPGDTTIFAATDRIRTGEELTLAEFGGGFVAQFTPTVGFWGVIDYSTEINGGRESREIWRANAGLRVAW